MTCFERRIYVAFLFVLLALVGGGLSTVKGAMVAHAEVVRGGEGKGEAETELDWGEMSLVEQLAHTDAQLAYWRGLRRLVRAQMSARTEVEVAAIVEEVVVVRETPPRRVRDVAVVGLERPE